MVFVSARKTGFSVTGTFALLSPYIRLRFAGMDEGRKRTLLIAACILAARKLVTIENKNSPAAIAAMSEAISLAERMMRKIDSQWPK